MENANAVLDISTYREHVGYAAMEECMMLVSHNVYAHNFNLLEMMDCVYAFRITFCTKVDV